MSAAAKPGGMRIVSMFRGDTKRGRERLRVYMKAQAAWPGLPQPIACTVRNISETGAKVMVPDPDAVPAEFDLELPEMLVAVRVLVMWRRGGHVGVTFVGAPQGATDGT